MERRANDTIMNETTPADGGFAVPTGLAPRVAARMSEQRLSDHLGDSDNPQSGSGVSLLTRQLMRLFLQPRVNRLIISRTFMRETRRRWGARL